LEVASLRWSSTPFEVEGGVKERTTETVGRREKRREALRSSTQAATLR
jgi:hypothetical protein